MGGLWVGWQHKFNCPLRKATVFMLLPDMKKTPSVNLGVNSGWTFAESVGSNRRSLVCGRRTGVFQHILRRRGHQACVFQTGATSTIVACSFITFIKTFVVRLKGGKRTPLRCTSLEWRHPYGMTLDLASSWQIWQFVLLNELRKDLPNLEINISG